MVWLKTSKGMCEVWHMITEIRQKLQPPTI